MPILDRFVTEDVYNITSGLNDTIANTKKSSSYFSSMKNMMFYNDEVRKEYGTSSYGSANAISGSAITNMQQYFSRTGVSHMLAFGDKVIAEFNATQNQWNDVSAVGGYSGSSVDFWRTTIHRYEMIATNNKKNLLQAKSGSDDFRALSGASYYAKDVKSLVSRLNLYNTTEGGEQYPRRIRWSVPTAFSYTTDDWSATLGGGFTDLQGGDDEIICSEYLGSSFVVIYLDRSLFTQEYVGGETIWSFESRLNGYDVGPISARAVCNMGDYHLVLTAYGIYKYSGDYSKEELGDPIHDTLFNILDDEYASLSLSWYDPDLKEACFAVPDKNSDNFAVFYYNPSKNRWRGPTYRTFLGMGFYREQNDLTWGDLIGNWSEQTFRWGDRSLVDNSPVILLGSSTGQISKIDKTIVNLDSTTAQESYFDTVDFVCIGEVDPKVSGELNNNSKVGYIYNYKRYQEISFELMGNSVTVGYSTDGGNTWTFPTNWTKSLTSQWAEYRFKLDRRAKKMRFRVINNSSGSDLRCRHIRLAALVEEEQ